MSQHTSTRTPRVETGPARSLAFVFDDKRERHAVVVVESDGSGHISIYNAKGRELATLTLPNRAHFEAIRDAVGGDLADEMLNFVKIVATGKPAAWGDAIDARDLLARIDGQKG